MGSTVTFADVVHPVLSFSREIPAHALLLELIDTRWVQRLRDISQTANTRLVYMFSEHSRFGHSLGVAYLADLVVQKVIALGVPDAERYRCAIAAAALLHDVGHLAPGSHTAFRSWFPALPDLHERIAERIVSEDPEVVAVLRRYGDELPRLVCQILGESREIPPWCWEIVSGGGWNVDRGNWCIVDSLLAGVSYGEYNIPALTESITVTADGHLALRENRLDAMMHFAVSRHAMYRQIYQHRVLLSADTINIAIVRRARDLPAERIGYCDDTMARVLEVTHPDQLELAQIFRMREAWWRYHLIQWQDSPDRILRDLAERLLHRRLFKTVRVQEHDSMALLIDEAQAASKELGYDPRYYLHHVSTADMHASDSQQSMLVYREDATISSLSDADPLFSAMSRTERRSWLVMPAEVKARLGRIR
jgi:uncharacterized protein